MAMISCPYCNEQVSDLAPQCPHCGKTLKETPQTPVICAECGSEIPYGAEVCPRCGCPANHTAPETQKVEVTKINLPGGGVEALKRRFSTVFVIFLAFILVGAIGVLSYRGIVMRKTQEAAAQTAKEYQTNLNGVTLGMLLGAAESEAACTLIHDVWYNTIYKKSSATTDKYTRTNMGTKRVPIYSGYNSDFNTSLKSLFADKDFSAKIASIQENQSTISTLMKTLGNPPPEYKDAYDAVKTLYDAYLSLTDLAINPTGNLQSFTSAFNTADTNFSKYYQAMSLYTTE